MNVIDSETMSMLFFRQSLHPDVIRVWFHPRIKSEDMLFGSML
jgi:hypothetical protein